MKKQKKKNTTQKSLSISPGLYNLISIIVIILTGFLIYSDTFKNTFNFDDIIWNSLAAVRNFDIKGLFDYNHFRFITFLSFAIEYKLHGLELFGYHFVNMMIHIGNGLLVWVLLRLIFKDLKIEKFKDSMFNVEIIALLGALIFVSHPLQTQAVTYIYQRLASLVTLFYLATVISYIKARLAEKDKKIIWFVLSGLSFLLAIFTKENAFTIPLIIALIEITFFQEKIKLKPIYFLYLILFIAGIVLLLFGFNIYKDIYVTYTTYSGDKINNLNYFITQFSVFLTYFRLLILPFGQNIDHDFPVVNNFFELPTIAGFLIILGLIVFAFYNIKRNKLIFFGILWFFLAISIESSIIPIMDVIMEHRLYLPMIGFIILIFGMLNYFSWEKHSKMILSNFIILIGFYSVLAYQRNKVWENELTLWSDAVEKSPNKARPYNGRGMAYYNQSDNRKALSDFNSAINLNPKFYYAYQNRGNVYFKLGKYKDAIADYTVCIDNDEYNFSNYNNRANSYMKIGEFDKAIEDYNIFINKNSNNYQIYCNRAEAYMAKQNFENAVSDFKLASTLQPNDFVIYNKIGDIFSRQEKFDSSLIYYTKSIELNSKSGIAYNNRATANFYLKNYKQAILDYQEAINLKFDLRNTYTYQAQAYEIIKDYENALKNYTSIISLFPKDFESYYKRGRIYSALNQKDKAQSDFKKALELNPNYQPALQELNRAGQGGLKDWIVR